MTTEIQRPAPEDHERAATFWFGFTLLLSSLFAGAAFLFVI